MQGLLAAFMNPPDDDEAGFNAWYDEEHVPNRLAVAGFLNGRRYKAAEAGGPRYLAIYDLESLEVLQSWAYQKLNEERSEREKDMMARIPMIDRRVLELVIDGQAWAAAPPYQLIVCMTPPTFMAVHELESPAVFQHPNYERSIATSWRQRIRSSVTRYERNLFELLHGLPQRGGQSDRRSAAP